MLERGQAMQELRALVGTYLEGSDDAARAADLLDALDPKPTPPPTLTALSETASARYKREDRERQMFGCTAAAIDEALATKDSRAVAMYAMGTLSNAQELIRREDYEGAVEWTVANHHDADTIRRLINVAKYAIDKAVSR